MVKKTKTPKVRVLKKKVVRPVTQPKELTYKVAVQFNGKRMECETNDLFEALSSISPKSPEYIKTRLNIDITKGAETISKMLLLGQARLFFRNDLSRRMFIKGLYFKN